MKNKKKFDPLKLAAAMLLSHTALFTGFVLYSRIRYKRSSGATAAEHVVNRRLGYILDTPESTRQYLMNRSLVEDQEYVIPKKKYKSHIYDIKIEGCQTVVFDGSGDSENTTIIMYIHGGGYAGEMTKYHAGFCDILAKRAKAKVIAPIYPLAPNHTYEETYDVIEKIYKSLIKQQKSVILAGDSAGGGFAAAFCQYLNQYQIPQAKKLILISPWVDLSMSGTGYETYEALDPLLKVEGLIVM